MKNKLQTSEFDGIGRKLAYLRYGINDYENLTEGDVKTLLLDIPYLIFPTSKGALIPPLSVLNEILKAGISDAGMSGGCEWAPFQISENEFKILVNQLLNDNKIKCEYVEPPNWVKTKSDWVDWKLEYIKHK